MTLAAGLELSNDWYDPIGYAVKHSDRVHKFYTDYPLAARITMVTANFLGGAAKPFLLPIFAVVGLIAKPIIASVKFFRGEPTEGKKWLAAWAFTLLATAGILAFLSLTGFYFDLRTGASLIILGCAASIAIHVSRVSDPVEHLPKPIES